MRLSPKQVGLICSAGVLAGIVSGLGSFTFIYAHGGSYMTNDPRACANCHIMREQYESWQSSSHHHVATCNDCHTPHNIFGKYYTKALNGYHHSLAFTTGNFSEPIRIKARNRGITERACRSCHADIVQMIDYGNSGTAMGPHRATEGIDCLRCHANVGHLE